MRVIYPIIGLALVCLAGCQVMNSHSGTYGSVNDWEHHEVKIGDSMFRFSLPHGQSMAIPAKAVPAHEVLLPLSSQGSSKSVFSGFWDFGATFYKQPDCTLRVRMTVKKSRTGEMLDLKSLRTAILAEADFREAERKENSEPSGENAKTYVLYTPTQKFSIIGLNGKDWLHYWDTHFATRIDDTHYLEVTLMGINGYPMDAKQEERMLDVEDQIIRSLNIRAI